MYWVLYMKYYRVYFVCFKRFGDHRDLHVLTHSFPTRRSADLFQQMRASRRRVILLATLREMEATLTDAAIAMFGALMVQHRSEEHTSELQSLMRISYAVFCLKKKYIYIHYYNTTIVITPYVFIPNTSIY